MGFYIRFVTNVESEFITKLVKASLLGVMAASYGINIVAFHVLEILAHIRLAENVTRVLVVFMIIHAFNQYGTTVY